MRRFEIMLVVIVVALVALGANRLFSSNADAPAPSAATSSLAKALERGELRCSYLIYAPYFRKDPNTGELTGIFHDLMEEIGKRAGLKVDWVEEVGYENIFTGLDTRRYDIFAGGLWPNTSRARAGSFTIPVFYSVIKAWGRTDEGRFADLAGLDSSSVRIATIDGAMEDIITQNDYPNATKVSLPQQSPFTQNLLNITTGKADVTFAEPGIVWEFLQNNPGTLKELAPDKALRIFGNSLVVRRGDREMQEFLDVALSELLYSGVVEKILAKYEPAPGVFPRVILPYRPETARLGAALQPANAAVAKQ